MPRRPLRAKVLPPLLLSAGLAAACAAQQRPPEKPPPGPDAGQLETPDDCGELGMELPEVQREVLCILLHRAGVPETFTVRWAQWPWRPATLMVLTFGGEPRDERNGYRPPGFKSNRMRVFAFDLAGEQPRLLAASGPGGVPLSVDDVAEFDDLKRYRLDAKGDHAVAVRVKRERRYQGGEAWLERLFAFRMRGKELEPILHTVMGYSTELSGGGAREASDATSRIDVSEDATNGCFDWVKRASDGSVRLLWTGSRYDMDGEDPVGEDPEAEIFQP